MIKNDKDHNVYVGSFSYQLAQHMLNSISLSQSNQKPQHCHVTLILQNQNKQFKSISSQVLLIFVIFRMN